MNLGELKLSVKRQFGDESAVQITDDDILRWVEQGQDEITRENEEILEARTTINLVAGTDEYAFPADLLTLRSVKIKDGSDSLGYVPVKKLGLAQFELSVERYQGIPGFGSPTFIYTTYESKIFLFPVPQNSTTAGLKLLYSKKPTVPVLDADELGLPPAYHMSLVKYCLVQAYELDENWEASGNKLAQLQLDLNRQANRSKGEPRDTYPLITVMPEDM